MTSAILVAAAAAAIYGATWLTKAPNLDGLDAYDLAIPNR